MFQPNVEETGITSNLLFTDGRSVLRRGVKTWNLGASAIKCKLNGQCNCWFYHYFIAHKSYIGVHSQAVTEKQLQAIIRSSDLNLKVPKNAGCKGNEEKSVVCEICIHEIKRILQLNLQHEYASFNNSLVVHLRRTLQDFDPICYAWANSLEILYSNCIF